MHIIYNIDILCVEEWYKITMRNGAKNTIKYMWLIKKIFLLAIICFIIILICNLKIYIYSTKVSKLVYFIDKENLHSEPSDCTIIILEEDSNETSKEENDIPQVTYSSTEVAKKFADNNALVIGDSTAEGLAAYKILNSNNVVWTRGRIVRDIEKDLDKANEYFTPKIIFLSYGANDLVNWQGNVDGFISSYKNATSTIRKKFPGVRICINSVLPVSQEALEKNQDFKYEQLFNQKLEEFCKSNDITFIDNRDLLKQSDNGKIYETDGIHPKYFYYNLWANNMVKVAGL